MFDSGFFTSTSVTVNGDGIPVGNKAKPASFLAEIFKRILGNGISMNPTSSFLAFPKTGMTFTVKAGWGVMNGYPFKLTEDCDITLTSSTAARTLYVGVRLDVDNNEFEGDNVIAYEVFSAETDRAFARIDIPADAIELTDAMFIDLRYNANYCGFIDEYRVSLQSLADELSTIIQEVYGESGISADALGVVAFAAAQELTGAQKAQAQANIGAAGLNTSGKVFPSQINFPWTCFTASKTLALSDVNTLMGFSNTSNNGYSSRNEQRCFFQRG